MSVRSDNHESFDKITVVKVEQLKLLDNTMITPPTLIVSPPSCLRLENLDVGVFNDENKKHRPNQNRREYHHDSCWSSFKSDISKEKGVVLKHPQRRISVAKIVSLPTVRE